MVSYMYLMVAVVNRRNACTDHICKHGEQIDNIKILSTKLN